MRPITLAVTILQTTSPILYEGHCTVLRIKMKTHIDIEEFIARSKMAHGDRYDYSNSIVGGMKNRISIRCRDHGEFSVTASRHYRAGAGCPTCFWSTRKASVATLDEFINEALIVHGNIYDYSKVDFVALQKSVTIVCREHGEFKQSAYNHIKDKNGCPTCAKAKSGKAAKTLVEFVAEARAVHGNKYDYSQTVYTKAIAKVAIICKKHGVFMQSADSHIRGFGCRKCSRNTRSSEDYFQEVVEKHKNYYDYSDAVYTNITDHVTGIVCPRHGAFQIGAYYHLKGKGCRKCGGAMSKRTSPAVQAAAQARFIEASKKSQRQQYDYSKTVYKGANNEVTVGCPVHGYFRQIASKHQKGTGCPECGILIGTTDRYIQKAIATHGNRYDYSETTYKSDQKDRKVFIICRKHGKFLQQATNHLSGANCPKCAGIISKVEKEWLDTIKVPERQKRISLGGRKSSTVDGFDPATNTVYQFHGDYWHGNPDVFPGHTMNKLAKKTHKELYDRTIARDEQLRALGYNVVVMWENDYKKMINLKTVTVDKVSS